MKQQRRSTLTKRPNLSLHSADEHLVFEFRKQEKEMFQRSKPIATHPFPFIDINPDLVLERPKKKELTGSGSPGGNNPQSNSNSAEKKNLLPSDLIPPIDISFESWKMNMQVQLSKKRDSNQIVSPYGPLAKSSPAVGRNVN
eukprot:TRINITY_DN6609_c0_g2_i1.p1 TRINITY_DN6609_c0_g2~~TRINITY_DN6609_c0_g2_i1.p1  ORF type:complete len:142 (+),score=26.07 TRINITY_DN6609_c0_g2_i1:114-539(+)